VPFHSEGLPAALCRAGFFPITALTEQGGLLILFLLFEFRGPDRRIGRDPMMPGSFRYRNGRLFCEQVAISDVVAKTGTPVYIYSRAHLVERLEQIQKAFRACDPIVCFSIKANSNINLLRVLAKKGSGFDVVSGGELYRALEAGARPRKIVYAGVGKTKEEIKAALEAGILMFNVESPAELDMINQVARRVGRKADVALRVNPDVDPHTHKYTTTGRKENKFGIDFESAGGIVERMAEYDHVRLLGLHVHIGSQITEVKPYVLAVRQVAKFAERCRDRAGLRLKYLNIGGGFGIQYDEERTPTAADFAKGIVPLVKRTGLRLIMEPGRFIAGNAGALVTSVLYTKVGSANKKTFVICDAAMNDLIRPALYGAYQAIRPVEDGEGNRPMRRCDVVGPVCESGDFLAKDRVLPEVKQGELLAVFGAGAYGFSMSSNYNSRPRSCEVLVTGRKFMLIRRRETYRDLVAAERHVRVFQP